MKHGVAPCFEDWPELRRKDSEKRYRSSAITNRIRANRPSHEVLRVVGERWSPRSHELRDSLARNTVPFGFYDADTDTGRRLLSEYGVDAERLPAVILHDGSVLHDPSMLDVAAALGVHTRPSSEVYDLVILVIIPASRPARSSTGKPWWCVCSTAPPDPQVACRQ